MSHQLVRTILATAVASLFMTPVVASDFVINKDIDAGHTQEGTSNDTIKTDSDGNYPQRTNNGTITGYGTLKIEVDKTLVNKGVIDVGHYDGEKFTSKLDNQGTIYVHDSNFGATLVNSGKVLVDGDSLELTNRLLTIKEGSVIQNAKTGQRLKLIKVDHKDSTAWMQLEQNAVLTADEVVLNLSRGFTLKGTIEGDKITVGGTYIDFAETGVISGRDVTLSQIDQINGEVGGNEKHGGSITATEKLTFLDFVNGEDIKITAPVILAHNNAFNLNGKSSLSGVKHLELGSTMTIDGDDVKINDNEFIDEVLFLGKTNANYGPRIQNKREQSLGIGNLTVNKVTNSKGEVITSDLIDQSTSKTEGLTSFDIGFIDVEKDAKLAIYGSHKEDGAKTNLKLGEVSLSDGAELQLGWTTDKQVDFAKKTIDTITLGTEAKVTKGTSVNEVAVNNIVFTGKDSSVENKLVGDMTNILIQEGATGNTLSAVETGKFNVTLEKTAKDSLHVTHTGDKTVVNVVATPENNSGDAQKDLNEIAQSVVFDDKKAHNVTQEADDMNDAFSGTVIDGKVGNVKVEANSNINGIAEMTAVGLHIWRNEINDMNKRLGELRDSSDDANGVWARVYNGKAKFGDQKITNKYTAFQFGYDRQVANGLWLGGAMSWTDGDSDFAVGGGDNSLMALTAYGSKLWDNGMFVDVTGKFGRIKNELDIRLANGRSSADYDANAVSVSAEAGWRVYPLNNGFFVEPQVEMMYGHVESVDYTTSTGVKVNQDSAETLIGRAGFVMGLKCPADRGNAYVRASVLHDWEGDANFKFSKDGVNSRAISESLGGTWYEYGIGANFNATKQLHIYADVEAANGGEVDTDYRVNLGMRYSF